MWMTLFAMTAEQKTAFEVSAGSSVFTSSVVWSGIAFTIVFLWIAWACVLIYRGWANKSLNSGPAGGAVLRLLVMLLILIFFWLS
jgi:integrating conjugative element protein, PFL_4701 family